MATITTKKLSAVKVRRWMSERINHGHGSLSFRGLEHGAVAVYFRYVDGGRRKSLPLGRYDEKGLKGVTLGRARQEAGRLSQQHASGLTKIAEYVQAERRRRNDAL